MNIETYYIPTNFTDAGRVMGLFEIRNMVEAILLGINDDSLTRWVGCWWRWRKGRRLISYRGEAGK